MTKNKVISEISLVLEHAKTFLYQQIFFYKKSPGEMTELKKTWSAPMFPLIFQSQCAHQNFFCATFYQDSSVFGTTCMKYVQKHFWKEHLYALKVFLCALISWLVCARTRAQLTGNIGVHI